jgi:arginine decarboxylase
MSSLLVPFSMGVAEGRWSSLITELLSFRDLYERNAPLRDVLPNLVDAHPRSYANMGLRDLCLRVQGAYAHLHTGRPQDDPHAVLPKVVMRPADAYECAVRGQIDHVEVDRLINRIVAVQVMPQPPGIALLMPGERISEETAAIQNYLLRVRQFDAACPGFEIQVDGLRVEHEGAARRYVVDCIRG